MPGPQIEGFVGRPSPGAVRGARGVGAAVGIPAARPSRRRVPATALLLHPTGIMQTATYTVYWHRDLPPMNAEIAGEHTVEATSGRVPGTVAHRSELWDRCYEELMQQTNARLQQEIARLGGRYAHVLTETIEPRHDDVAGEAWLHGRFTYMLYKA